MCVWLSVAAWDARVHSSVLAPPAVKLRSHPLSGRRLAETTLPFILVQPWLLLLFTVSQQVKISLSLCFSSHRKTNNS